MPRTNRPRRRGPNRSRAWRREHTGRIIRARRARMRAHTDTPDMFAEHLAPVRLDEYLAVRHRGDLPAGKWSAGDLNPWIWKRIRQLDWRRPAPTPPLCRCLACRVPLDWWAPDLRYVRRIEHREWDLRDGDPRWVSAVRRRQVANDSLG